MIGHVLKHAHFCATLCGLLKFFPVLCLLFVSESRLNKEPPNLTFRKKEKGGINLTSTVNNTHLDLETVKAICSEYRIHNADITLRCDATADDLIDVIEGSRVYMPCIYVINKVDQITLEELEILDKLPHYCPIRYMSLTSSSCYSNYQCTNSTLQLYQFMQFQTLCYLAVGCFHLSTSDFFSCVFWESINVPVETELLYLFVDSLLRFFLGCGEEGLHLCCIHRL